MSLNRLGQTEVGKQNYTVRQLSFLSLHEPDFADVLMGTNWSVKFAHFTHIRLYTSSSPWGSEYYRSTNPLDPIDSALTHVLRVSAKHPFAYENRRSSICPELDATKDASEAISSRHVGPWQW
jgi:hypothetical protein